MHEIDINQRRGRGCPSRRGVHSCTAHGVCLMSVQSTVVQLTPHLAQVHSSMVLATLRIAKKCEPSVGLSTVSGRRRSFRPIFMWLSNQSRLSYLFLVRCIIIVLSNRTATNIDGRRQQGYAILKLPSPDWTLSNSRFWNASVR